MLIYAEFTGALLLLALLATYISKSLSPLVFIAPGVMKVGQWLLVTGGAF